MTGTWSDPRYEAIAELLSSRAGLVFPHHRVPDVERAIRKGMHRAGLDNPRAYRARVAGSGRAFDDLVSDVTVAETYFFRDAGQMEVLRAEVLPEIRARRNGGPVRAWSAGCATGEETFTMAILLREAGFDAIHLVGTDISRSSLARAEVGVYRPWSLRGVTEDARMRYFTRRENGYAIDEAIRRLPVFEYQNLALDTYPSMVTGLWGMDLIVCRNVLIYFAPETVARVAEGLAATLAEDGWLVTSPSDPMLDEVVPLVPVMTAAGMLYRRATARDPAASPAPPGGLDRERAEASDLPPAHGPGEPDAPESPNRKARADALPPSPRDATTAAQLAEPGRSSFDVIRKQANSSLEAAEALCTGAIAAAPLEASLQYLHALLLLELARPAEAAVAARRAAYLDRSFAAAWFLLGTILRRLGDRDGARVAYRSARVLCLACPRDEPVPFSDGEPAGRLADAAAAELDILEAVEQL